MCHSNMYKNADKKRQQRDEHKYTCTRTHRYESNQKEEEKNDVEEEEEDIKKQQQRQATRLHKSLSQT